MSNKNWLSCAKTGLKQGIKDYAGIAAYFLSFEYALYLFGFDTKHIDINFFYIGLIFSFLIDSIVNFIRNMRLK